MINRALMTGFMSVGCAVEDLQVMPIPVVRHAVHHGGEAGGIHVRRSPFDPKVVDILFFDGDGRDLPPGKTQSIERLFTREDFPRAGPDGTGDLNFPTRVIDRYHQDFLNHVDRESIAEKRFNIVIDFAYGTTVNVLPGILGALNADVVSLDAYAAPGRLSRTDDEFRGGLGRLGGIVRSIGAHLGVWIDPGGEVIHLVDDTGRPMSADVMQLLLVDLAFQHLGVRRVALPVTTSAALAERVRAQGGEVAWSKTEHHAMMASATDVDMVAGTRGEFIFSRFLPAYDGMFAIVKLLEALALADRPLSAIADGYAPIFKSQERVSCPWGRKGAVMRQLMESTEGSERQLVDGVKIWEATHAWTLVIPHSDKPYFVVTAEGPDRETADALVGDYTARVERWRDDA